jgi:acyl transferase domain-containing protein
MCAGIPDVAVACDNSRNSVVLAGPARALLPILAALKREGVKVREIRTEGVAYNSPAMARFVPALTEGPYRTPILFSFFFAC